MAALMPLATVAAEPALLQLDQRQERLGSRCVTAAEQVENLNVSFTIFPAAAIVRTDQRDEQHDEPRAK